MAIGNRWSKQQKHIVSIGGGTASTLELPFVVLDKYGFENVDFVIAALAGESPDLWRMVEWLEQRTGKHVYRVAWQPQARGIYHGLRGKYWINAPEWAWHGIWSVFFKTGRMGSTLADPCSRMLKRETLAAFIDDHYSAEHTTLHVGITADEVDRMIAITRNWSKRGYRVEADLADVQIEGTSAERAEKILGWVPEVYQWGASHNNCGGFCVKAGHAQMARFLTYAPDAYAYHERMERKFRQETGTTATIMRDRKTRNGITETTPLTLESFRMRIEARGFQVSMFDPDPETGCRWCGAA